MQILADNILIKPMPWPEQKHGSILLPDNQKARQTLCRGEIIAVGPGGYTQQGVQLPPDIKPGEYAYYLKRGCVPVMVNEWEMDLVSEREILMTLTAEEIGREKEKTNAAD